LTSDNIPREHLYSKKPRTQAGSEAVAALQELSWTAHAAQDLVLSSLGMGMLDARALLHLVQEVRHGFVVRPTDLMVVLNVSSAAITKLVDRLVQSGHIERQPNPSDRRGVVLVPTQGTTEQLAEVYGRIHMPLVAVIDELSDAELDTVARFSKNLAVALAAETRLADRPDGSL
jgi:DNA-binding MarR family transcriptional regulator